MNASAQAKSLTVLTLNAVNGRVDVDGVVPVEEADDALELRLLGEPQLCLHPQPAADLVIFSIPKGSGVRRHAVGDLEPVDLPGHADVVGVESSGQTHQSLLLRLALLVLALFG